MTMADRQELATRFLPRIRRMARGFCRQLPSHIDAEDLTQAGIIGMLSALRSFDPGRGDRVEVYVVRRIRGAILDELRALDPLSRDQRRDARAVQRAARALEVELGRPPGEDELAERAGVSVDRVRALHSIALASATVALEQGGLECEAPAADPCDRLTLRKLTAHLVSCIAMLAPREQSIIALYYVDELSLKQIGNLLGVTESRVCQIHGAAVKKLRACMEPN